MITNGVRDDGRHHVARAQKEKYRVGAINGRVEELRKWKVGNYDLICPEMNNTCKEIIVPNHVDSM